MRSELRKRWWLKVGEKKRRPPRKMLLCASRGRPRWIGVKEGSCRAIQLRTTAFCLLKFPFFAPLAATAILRVSSKGQIGGMGALSFINGPSQPAFAGYIPTCTYELRSRSPPRNSRYAMLGSLSLSSHFCRADYSHERYLVTRLLGKY